MDKSSSNQVLREYILANQTASKVTGGCKCQWNSKLHCLKFNKIPFIFNCILCGLFGISVILQSLKLALSNTSTDFKSIGVIVATGTLLSYHCTWVYLRSTRSFEWIFNNLCMQEGKHCQNRKESKQLENKITKTATLTCKFLRVGFLWQIGIVFGLFGTLLPFTPLNIFGTGLGYWILDWVPRVPFLGKILMFLSCFVFWITTSKLIIITLIEKICGSTSLVLLIHKFEQGEIPILMKNQISSRAQLYREIQILNERFNEIESQQLVACLLTFGICQIAAAVHFIRTSVGQIERIPSAFLAKYVVLGFDFQCALICTIVINFLFTSCASVHDTSVKSLRRIRQNMETSTPKEHKKVLNSFSTIRVKFGVNNYLEKLTPVTFQIYLVERIIDALLLKK